MTAVLQTATIAAALGATLSGGALYAFSSFVMPGLSRLPDEVGLRAMQAINEAAPTPSFLIPLLGTGVLTAGTAVGAAGSGTGATLHVAATVLYGVSTAVTIGYHVPRNRWLGTHVPDAAGAAAWRVYRAGWTRWNHVRSAAAIGAGAVLVLAALTHGRAGIP